MPTAGFQDKTLDRPHTCPPLFHVLLLRCHGYFFLRLTKSFVRNPPSASYTSSPSYCTECTAGFLSLYTVPGGFMTHGEMCPTVFGALAPEVLIYRQSSEHHGPCVCTTPPPSYIDGCSVSSWSFSSLRSIPVPSRVHRQSALKALLTFSSKAVFCSRITLRRSGLLHGSCRKRRSREAAKYRCGKTADCMISALNHQTIKPFKLDAISIRMQPSAMPTHTCITLEAPRGLDTQSVPPSLPCHTLHLASI